LEPQCPSSINDATEQGFKRTYYQDLDIGEEKGQPVQYGLIEMPCGSSDQDLRKALDSGYSTAARVRLCQDELELAIMDLDAVRSEIGELMILGAGVEPGRLTCTMSNGQITIGREQESAALDTPA
jgi:hypothetical protein